MQSALTTSRTLANGEIEVRSLDAHRRRTYTNSPRALWTPAGWRVGAEVWTRGRDGWDSEPDFAGYDPTAYATQAECQTVIDAMLEFKAAA